MKSFKKINIVLRLIISLSILTSCDTTSVISADVQYKNPSWAPQYYPGVRYYYFPDIESYYDLSSQEFIYLNNGQWLYSNTLPSIYSSYDLFNGFTIALNFSVFQPWMHHQYYVSHYPRFYYHNVYRNGEINNIRGFNENERKPFYWRQQDRDRINDWRKNVEPEKRQEVSRPPQRTHYYGKDIGRPVKVKPQMKESKPGNKRIQRPQ